MSTELVAETPEGRKETGGGRTLELLVEARDAGRDREVDGLVTDVDDDASEGALVDPVFKHEGLFPVGLGHLGLVQRVLEALLEVLFEGLGGGDDDLDLSAVSLHDLEEAVDDLVGLVEATVLGQDGEQVAGQVGRTFSALGDRGGEEGVESGCAVLVREDGVREKVVDLGVGADGGFDALEVRLDLLEGVGLGSGGEECAGVLASEACGRGSTGGQRWVSRGEWPVAEVRPLVLCKRERR